MFPHVERCYFCDAIDSQCWTVFHHNRIRLRTKCKYVVTAVTSFYETKRLSWGQFNTLINTSQLRCVSNFKVRLKKGKPE